MERKSQQLSCNNGITPSQSYKQGTAFGSPLWREGRTKGWSTRPRLQSLEFDAFGSHLLGVAQQGGNGWDVPVHRKGSRQRRTSRKEGLLAMKQRSEVK